MAFSFLERAVQPLIFHFPVSPQERAEIIEKLSKQRPSPVCTEMYGPPVWIRDLRAAREPIRMQEVTRPYNVNNNNNNSLYYRLLHKAEQMPVFSVKLNADTDMNERTDAHVVAVL